MKNKKLILIILISIAIIATGSFAYGIWKLNSNKNSIKTGNITFNYKESNSNINIENSSPITDEEGKEGKYFDFDISATTNGQINISYYIYLSSTDISNINNKYIKVYLTKLSTDGSEEEIVKPTKISDLTPFDKNTISYNINSSDLLLYSNTFNLNDYTTDKISYRLRFWISDDYSDTTETSDSNINIEAKTYGLNVNVIGINDNLKEISR